MPPPSSKRAAADEAPAAAKLPKAAPAAAAADEAPAAAKLPKAAPAAAAPSGKAPAAVPATSPSKPGPTIPKAFLSPRKSSKSTPLPNSNHMDLLVLRIAAEGQLVNERFETGHPVFCFAVL